MQRNGEVRDGRGYAGGRRGEHDADAKVVRRTGHRFGGVGRGVGLHARAAGTATGGTGFVADVDRDRRPCRPCFVPVHRGSDHAAGARTDVLVGVVPAAALVVGGVGQHHVAQHWGLGSAAVERGSPLDGRPGVGEGDLLPDAAGFPRRTAVVGDVQANAGAGGEGAEDTVNVDGVDGSWDGRGLTDDHLGGERGRAHVVVGAVAVGVDLPQALIAVAGAGPMAREHDFVVVGVDHPVVAATGHHPLALTRQKAAGHREVIVGALVVRVHVVDVVHDVGHADRQARSVVVVVRRGRHQPGSGDHGGGGRVHLLEVVILRRSVVNGHVHLAGGVIKVNARDVVWILVVVGGFALPLDLRTGRIPSDLPLVHHVVGVVGGVDVAVVDVGIVNAAGG